MNDFRNHREIFENNQEHEIWANVDHPNVMAVIGKCFNSFPMLSILEAVEVIFFITITVVVIITIILVIITIVNIIIGNFVVTINIFKLTKSFQTSTAVLRPFFYN